MLSQPGNKRIAIHILSNISRSTCNQDKEIWSVKGATKLYFTCLSYVVIVYVGLHFLQFFLKKTSFLALCAFLESRH